jgi:hypothetical protein
MAETLRVRPVGVVAVGVLALATAAAGAGVALTEHARGDDVASWCTIQGKRIYVDDTTIVTTPQIGPIWCPP